MHAKMFESWRHEHVFLGQDHNRNERRSWAVVALCGAMMAAEIIGGLLWGSMALIAAQLGHSDTRMVEKHYGHLAPSYVADTVRAAFGSLGIVEPSNVLLPSLGRYVG